MADTPTSAERETGALSPSVEHAVLVVQQPRRLEAMLVEIGDISEEAPTHVSEEGTSSGGAKGSQKSTVASHISPREHAIANLPPPPTMQKELQKHIQGEVKKLRREANRIVRLSRPGAAFRLNLIYTRIRSLRKLLSELWEASYETFRRLFIRIFIDKQPVL